ncbi:MAG: SpoIIE family protein phosphatase [Bacteroidales bacterium]|nr:SpoIIE family protein phosphatase [Bacteroidales bacterium]
MIFNIRPHKRIIRSNGRIIFLFTGLILCGIISGQTYFFDNYGPEQGLISSKVYSIIQARDDYIWLGTVAGATRFDGTSFINYKTEDGLAPKGVRTIFEDNSGNIWFGHIGGALTRYNGKIFESIFITDTLPDLDVTSIIHDKDGCLWISTSLDGVYKIENPDGKTTRINYAHFKGGRLGDRVFNSLLMSDGTLYFVTDLGIKKYIPVENTFQTYSPEGLDTYFAISVLFEDSKRNFWFGTYNGGLYKMDSKNGEFTFIDTKNGLAANWITNIIEDKSGNIWTGHWDNNFDKGGITRIDPKGDVKVFDKSNGLQDHKIYSLVCDKENNILIGTYEHGFSIFKGELFTSYTTPDVLINDQVSAITEDADGRMWFGTNGGITVFNKETGDTIHYNQSNNHISDQIRFLRKDPDGNIWIGTSDQGIIRYDYQTRSFEYVNDINMRFPRTPQGYSLQSVKALETDRDYNVYVGTLDGLLWYNSRNNTITDRRTVDGLPSNNIRALYVDSKNTLWVGGEISGLAKKAGDTFERIEAAKEVTPTCISEDSDGNLWIGTEIHGVLCISDSIIARYTENEGLLSDMIHFINVDDNNQVYVGTTTGLNKIIPLEKKVITYTKKSGFTGIETKNNATYKDLEGNLWFGTANGVMRYNSRLDKHIGIEPLTHITRMTVNNVETQMNRKLKLSPNQKIVQFFYTSICLTDPDAVRYKIMLEGFIPEWNDVGTVNNQIYNLSPGKYTFKVIAKNNEGNWNKEPRTFTFRVLAPVYQRAWFIIAFIILLGFAIISYIKIRERNLVREKRNLEIKVKERTLALSKANEELAIRNKDITDSIKYAKRIQFAILPPEIPFNDTFVLFKPKDIVSGDFFWLTTHKGKEFIAAVDCTGHGVPGAFMSFIGFTSLNKIVIEQSIHEPAEILNHLNEEVASNLHQKGEDIVNDGMDIALVCYDPEKRQLQYSGAFNPLWLIRNSEILEIKANRFAIGRSTGIENRFTNHVIEIQDNDIIYLFTDGYSDQFGGKEGKKFKTGNFKELLISIHANVVDEQRDILDKTIEDWRGDLEQIDDMLIIGRKFV